MRKFNFVRSALECFLYLPNHKFTLCRALSRAVGLYNAVRAVLLLTSQWPAPLLHVALVSEVSSPCVGMFKRLTAFLYRLHVLLNVC
ncbi:hypothetical protein M514_21429 [Trichuris suis]|uniref:Uncharacterized protein n=1 Tax=Trichuris suis TaxID=68888 RepID=A0A085NAA3_9BILA|nr:hypothetical protein M514_21429 [Trichuris suis]